MTTNGPPTLDYARPNPKTPNGILLVTAILGGLVFVSLIASFFLPSITRTRPVANRVKCASNLRQIGQAILLYSNDHHGVYPDSFETLLLNEDITSEVFICLASNDTPATGPTTQAVAANLTAPGHLSYIYLASGWTVSTTPPNAVVAYEPLANHAGDGMNVLFGDGHVEFFTAAQAQSILTNAAPGKPPVTIPSKP